MSKKQEKILVESVDETPTETKVIEAMVFDLDERMAAIEGYAEQLEHQGKRLKALEGTVTRILMDPKNPTSAMEYYRKMMSDE